ncbi:hypothetical protein ACF0H5_022531 [Mactra antiquata]
MAAPDMEVIKEIPGYKVILKAVLKSQIQQLVEQLARSTDEESVILTASVADGTLCHLGSDSGKVFLEDHEDIKSQFLGFCLKRHHKQQQEKERKETQEREDALARSMAPTTPPRYGGMGPRPSFMSQRSPRYGAPHPITLSRASPGSNVRSPGVRHSPYPMNRAPRPRLSLDQQKWSGGTGQGPGPVKMSDGQVIKIEPDEDNDDNNDKPQPAESSQPSSPSAKPTTPSHGPGTSDNDDAKSESSSSTVLNDPLESKVSDTLPASNLSLDSDLSNLISAAADNDPNNSQSGNTQDSTISSPQTSGQLDPNISVKLEATGDSEMDLEITGVELGQRPPTHEPMSSQNWMQSVQAGASGSSADLGGYKHDAAMWLMSHGKRHTCKECGQVCSSPALLTIHLRKHTGERPYSCMYCEKTFALTSNMYTHIRKVHDPNFVVRR